MAPAANLGLKLGLAALFVALLAALLPFLSLLFALLAVASAAVLRGDACQRGPGEARAGLLAVVLVAVGFLALIVASQLARAAPLDATMPPAGAVWVAAAGEVAVAAGLWLAPAHLAAGRSRSLLGLALGASIATSLIVAGVATAGTSEQLNAAVGAKGVPFILFAWAYATMLGRLRAEARAGHRNG